jgi:hypothetical protein
VGLVFDQDIVDPETCVHPDACCRPGIHYNFGSH